jgi:hypothetical protein
MSIRVQEVQKSASDEGLKMQDITIRKQGLTSRQMQTLVKMLKDCNTEQRLNLMAALRRVEA